MSGLAEEFRDILDLYVKLFADLTRITDVGKSEEEDPQALIQSILGNQSCLTEIEQLNKRLVQLYGVWKDEEAYSDSTGDNEIRSVVADIQEQMRQLEKLCGINVREIEARRKQLSGNLTDVGKGFDYLKLLKPIRENHPKFIDSDC